MQEFPPYLSNNVIRLEELQLGNEEIISIKFEEAVKKLSVFRDLTNYDNEESKKRTINYLDWIVKKTDIICNEDILIIPKNVLPKKIAEFIVNKLSEEDKTLVNRFYSKIDHNYFLEESKDIDNESVVKLVKSLLLKRSYVVWVEFGFNIDEEFGGKHPALILKQTGNSLIVVPLSSQEPKEIKEYHVKIDKVYNYRTKIRWANVHRIRAISVLRVDFNSPVGDVKGSVMNNISAAIKESGIR